MIKEYLGYVLYIFIVLLLPSILIGMLAGLVVFILSRIV